MAKSSLMSLYCESSLLKMKNCETSFSVPPMVSLMYFAMKPAGMSVNSSLWPGAMFLSSFAFSRSTSNTNHARSWGVGCRKLQYICSRSLNKLNYVESHLVFALMLLPFAKDSKQLISQSGRNLLSNYERLELLSSDHLQVTKTYVEALNGLECCLQSFQFLFLQSLFRKFEFDSSLWN